MAHSQSTDIKVAIRTDGEAIDSGAETFHEWKDGALPLPIDFLEGDAKDARILKFADEHLAFEGAEAVVVNGGDSARRTNPGVRKPDGGQSKTFVSIKAFKRRG